MDTHAARILVVDDDPAICRALEARLGDAGHHVQSVMFGEHAVQFCTRNAPDILLLDVSLPDMDGYQVCEQVRARVDAPGMTIVFLTGSTNYGPHAWLGQNVNQSGGDYFLAKPYDGNLLVGLIDEIVRENHACA